MTKHAAKPRRAVPDEPPFRWYSNASDGVLRYLLEERWDGRGGDLSKVDIERLYFGDISSQAQGITTAWRERLGVETKLDSKLQVRFDELKADAVAELELAAKKFRELGFGLLAKAFEAKAMEMAQS